MDLEAKRIGVENLITLLKENGKTQTIHFSADASSTELVYRTTHSAIQLSIYGAVAGCGEDFGMKSDEKPAKTINDGILK